MVAVDDPIFALAILALGTFVGVLVTTVFYVMFVRPLLVIPAPIEDENSFRKAMNVQRTAMLNLQHSLDAHTQQLGIYLAEMEEASSMPPLVQPHDSELDRLLLEHHALLSALQISLETNQADLTTHFGRLSRQLVTNSVLLQKLAVQAHKSTQQSVLLGEIRTQLIRLIEQVQTLSPQPAAHPTQDRLADIKGIGPVYSGMLHEAGINTFEQLAALTPEELNALLNLPKWRAASMAGWIEQARLLTSQRQKLERLGG
jgi:hypothetical protein